MAQPLYLKVFLSSPADVLPVRKAAMSILTRFSDRPAFRDKVIIRVVAWDKPGADTPMLAQITPQDAINSGLPKPSECDIVVVIFGAVMGTPFVDESGQEFLSGTHWELLDALKGSDTDTVIYRCSNPGQFVGAANNQIDRVDEFFRSALFYLDGMIRRGVNTYDDVDDFKTKFETHLEALIVRRLTQQEIQAPGVQNAVSLAPIASVSKPALKDDFVRIISDADVNLDKVRRFIEENPHLLMNWAVSGGGEKKFLSGISFDQAQADFALGIYQATIDQWKWVLVLLESPAMVYFASEGTYTVQLSQALERANHIRATLQSKMLDIRTFIPDIQPNVQILILAGRRADVPEAFKNKLSLLRLAMPGITVNTYDALLDSIGSR
jgi:hypothetical protein